MGKPEVELWLEQILVAVADTQSNNSGLTPLVCA